MALDQYVDLTPLDVLSERDKQALLLVAWEGLTPREVADVLGTTSVAQRARLSRARRKVRRRLADSALTSRTTLQVERSHDDI